LKHVNLGEKPRLTGDVVVVGGGSTAMDAARSALRSGADKVTILYRRSRSDMPAQAEEVAAAEREGIVLRTDTMVTAVLGRELVTGVRTQRQAATGESDGGRAVFAPVAGTVEEVGATTVLVAVGEEPDPSILPEGAGIGVSAIAGISADERTLATSRPGVFAGGDVVSGPKTIIDAVGAGRRAAASVHEYLAGAGNGEAEIFATVRYDTPPEPKLTLDLAVTSRAHAPLPLYEPGSFSATQQGFTEPTARAEASRCFRCDAVYSCNTIAVVAGRGPRDAPHPGGPPRPQSDAMAYPAGSPGAPS
jgi:formate dehydrogenase beta subunit